MKANLIGVRLRDARNCANPKVTQGDLSVKLRALGVSLDETMISKIEKGRRGVSDIEVVAVSKALQISPLWLLGLEEQK